MPERWRVVGIAMKIGRNDPCYCGSGKKYKKCHLAIDRDANADSDLSIALEQLRAKQAEIAEREYNGYYLPHIQTVHQGKRVRAVGSLLSFRPLDETFHEFTIDLLRYTLGRKWLKRQRKLPETDRHFIARCYTKHLEWRERNKTEGNREGNRYGAFPDGWTRSLFSLAYDIYCLRHRATLPQRLINRLGSTDQYQGARYEIAISAMFTRLGFEIEFLDSKKYSGRRCEFIATHPVKSVSVAVEAKSRHRRGVIHFSGESTETDRLKGDIASLLEDALSQNPGDMPFMIFVDLNAPVTPHLDVPDKPWFKDIWKIIDGYGANSEENPDPFNAIYVTNFSFHYEEDQTSGKGEYIFIIPKYSKHPLVDQAVYGLLEKGLADFGNVPDLE
jgi:hypothetical protein